MEIKRCASFIKVTNRYMLGKGFLVHVNMIDYMNKMYILPPRHRYTNEKKYVFCWAQWLVTLEV